MDADDLIAGNVGPDGAVEADEERECELEAIAEEPGTWFNPQTEMTLVVAPAEVDQTNLPEPEDGSTWIRVSDEPALDEQHWEELIQELQVESLNSATVDSITLEPDDGYDSDGFDDPDEIPPPAAV